MQQLVVELLLLLSACVLSTEADTFYLQYLHTASSSRTDGPEFIAVGWVDGEEFMYYDSNIMKATPKTEWIKKSEADYWDRETDRQQHDQYILMYNLNAVMQSFNHIEGNHTLQRLYSCELHGNGTTGGHMQYCYDGEDCISLDLTTGTWTAVKPEVESFIKMWEYEGRGADYWKSYIENECISWLKVFVSYGGESLKGKGDKHVNHRETFTCMVQNNNMKEEYHKVPKGGSSEGGSKEVWIPIVVIVVALIVIGIVVLVFRKNIISGFRPVSKTSNDMSLR